MMMSKLRRYFTAENANFRQIKRVKHTTDARGKRIVHSDRHTSSN